MWEGTKEGGDHLVWVHPLTISKIMTHQGKLFFLQLSCTAPPALFFDGAWVISAPTGALLAVLLRAQSIFL